MRAASSFEKDKNLRLLRQKSAVCARLNHNLHVHILMFQHNQVTGQRSAEAEELKPGFQIIFMIVWITVNHSSEPQRSQRPYGNMYKRF